MSDDATTTRPSTTAATANENSSAAPVSYDWPKTPWIVSSWIDEFNNLLEQHASTGIDDFVRTRFRQLLHWFPSSTAIHYSWMQLEWRAGNWSHLETLFSESLRPWGDVRMWRLYLQYTTQMNGPDSRETLVKAYELALSHVGWDLQASSIYLDYLDLLMRSASSSSAAATAEGGGGGGLYEEQQRMDQIRRVFHRALAIPLDNIEGIWHRYDAYENSLNRATAKKILSDKGPTYMAARVAAKELAIILDAVERDNVLPALPPSDKTEDERAGESAEDETLLYERWFRWIRWEQKNPLKLPVTSTILTQRINYAFRCSLRVLRHYSEAWFEYARWWRGVSPSVVAAAIPTLPSVSGVSSTASSNISSNKNINEAIHVLRHSISILPTDLLVSFSLADLLEQQQQLQQQHNNASLPSAAAPADHSHSNPQIVYEELIERLISAMPAAPSPERASQLAEHLTLATIQQMHCARRTEGLAAARAIFTRARKSPHPLGWQLYVASAQMELYCGRRDAQIASKIYELGMSQHGRNVHYLLEYLRHLLALGDETNARALFERALTNLATAASTTPSSAAAAIISKNDIENDEVGGRVDNAAGGGPSSGSGTTMPGIAGALEVWKTFLDWQFRWGEGETVRQLLDRFRATFPDEPITAPLCLFSRQYGFDDQLQLATERTWNILSLAAAGGAAPAGGGGKHRIGGAVQTPFVVPEVVWNLQLRLPAATEYQGPAINSHALIKILQNLRVDAPGHPIEREEPGMMSSYRGTGSSGPARSTGRVRKASSTSSAAGRTSTGRSSRSTRRDRYRLDGDAPEGEQRIEQVSAVDDLFAQRYAR
jgi:tetratricopeptide (TPR) repeat protein